MMLWGRHFSLCPQFDSGIQGRRSCLPRKAFGHGEGFFALQRLGMLLTFSQQGPGILNILQCRGHFPTTKNYPAVKAKSNPIKKHWSTVFCSHVQLYLQHGKLDDVLWVCVCNKFQQSQKHDLCLWGRFWCRDSYHRIFCQVWNF